MIGVITALAIEAAAVRQVLHARAEPAVRGDPNHYVRATVAGNAVVATTLVATGNPPAADASANLVRSFPDVQVIVMCGIALGVPRPEDPARDVRLGDIVVGTGGIVHYGHRRITDEGATLRGEILAASPTLMRGVEEIRIAQVRGERPWQPWLTESPSFSRPEPGASKVFYGRIGSADELLRSAARRDEVALPTDLLAMEMEGAGVAGSAALGGRECLVIRGVSDYGDAEKDDSWQPYAALAAAAYLRALLETLATSARATGNGLMELVKRMERVPSLQTPGDRDTVLRLMGPPVASRAARDPRTRIALLSLAMVCADQRSGFTTLIEALTELEGPDSETLRDLATEIERFMGR